VVDDHALVVEGICSILKDTYEIVGVAADGRKLLEKAPKLKPDVIVLDICMPLLNGLDAARHLKEFLPKIKFVFLTMRDDRNLAAAALKLGPVGFVLKHSAASELQKAISEILLGKSYVTPKLRPDDWMVGEERAKSFSKELSPRQREVLQLLAEGRPMKEVASILSLSEKTVNFHKYHMMQTFDLRSNADLVLFALKQGLISA
jgi:DNA-binding NarL/FixJ family response regulator